MSENTTSSSTRKLKRLLFFLIAIAMIAGSLMAAFLKAMTVKAEENKIVYFDTVKQLEAGHIFKNPKDLITYFVNNTTDPEDGYKTAEKSDIKIIWFEYYGLTENELQWKKNSSEVNDIYGTPLKPGKYTVAFRNVDSGKKWSDTYVSIFYVNAPIKVAYRAVTVDPNTGAKSYKNIKIENAEVTTNPNGSSPININVNEKWCQSGFHFDNMAVVKASTGSRLKSWSNAMIDNRNLGNYGTKPVYTNSYQTKFSTKYQTCGDMLYVDCYYTDNKPNIFAGIVTFPYGTVFKTDYDLISQITRGVQDDEDVIIDISEVKVINLSSTAEAETTTNSTNYRGRVLSSGEYHVTLMVVDSRGAFDRKVVTFYIADSDIPNPDNGEDSTDLNIKSSKKTYLQGTDITGALLSTQMQVFDKVSGEILTYTDGPLTQGKFTITDRGGLNSNKVTNYSFEHYLRNTAACDAENTYTITYKYKTRGNAVGTATAEAVIIPVFPYFEATYTNCQIFEGYMPVYNEDGTIASFYYNIFMVNIPYSQ